MTLLLMAVRGKNDFVIDLVMGKIDFVVDDSER